jgi:hypothetical protein
MDVAEVIVGMSPMKTLKIGEKPRGETGTDGRQNLRQVAVVRFREQMMDARCVYEHSVPVLDFNWSKKLLLLHQPLKDDPGRGTCHVTFYVPLRT